MNVQDLFPQIVKEKTRQTEDLFGDFTPCIGSE